jgi:hypothetical protein
MARKRSNPEAEGRGRELVIAAPNLKVAQFTIRGTAPLVLNAFSEKARNMMKTKQEAGSTAKKGRQREAKDFQACFEGAKHVSDDGWLGFAASGIRAAMVSACRIVGFKMTLAKLSLFVLADGYDRVDGTALVRITKGTPIYVEHPTRNETGVCDIRPRPMWKQGWEAILRIQFDADQFKLEDVANLLMRVGTQVGIGEGRADSKKSCGMGWGFFEIASRKQVE